MKSSGKIKFHIRYAPNSPSYFEIIFVQAEIVDIEKFPFKCHDCAAKAKAAIEKKAPARIVVAANGTSKSSRKSSDDSSVSEKSAAQQGDGVLIMIDTTKTAN